MSASSGVRAAMQLYRERALDAEQRVAVLEDECRGLREKYAAAVERAWPEVVEDEGDAAVNFDYPAAVAVSLGQLRGEVAGLSAELRDVAAWIAEQDGRAPATQTAWRAS